MPSTPFFNRIDLFGQATHGEGLRHLSLVAPVSMLAMPLMKVFGAPIDIFVTAGDLLVDAVHQL